MIRVDLTEDQLRAVVAVVGERVSQRSHPNAHPSDHDIHLKRAEFALDSALLAREQGGETNPPTAMLDEVVKDAFARTLRERGADLAADRLELLDPDQAWESYFGPVADQIEETLQ